MRLSVDGAGYATAASAFADGNHLAALHHDSLTGKLAGYAAMAGNDASAAEFAAAYDRTATEAVHALVDLVAAFATLGRLTEQSITNHRAANARSIVAGAVIHDGTGLPDAGYVSVLPSTSPTSLGGDSPRLPAEVAWVLDGVQGFTWPNADTDRLRDAAHLWRAAAGSLDELATYCPTAAAALEPQRSPEIPLALGAVNDLESSVRELADQYASLGDSCTAYADHVDGKREEILALVREVLAMVVEGIAISGAIGVLTAGGGAFVGGGTVAARVAAQAPRFAAILASLRGLTATTAARLHATHAGIGATRARLDRFLGNPVRTEAGHLKILGASRWRRGWLSAHERSGGHTITAHVGRTPAMLALRISENPKIPYASSFRSQAEAEDILEVTLSQHRSKVVDWLSSRAPSLRLDSELASTTGISVNRSGEVLDVTGVRAILVRDSGMPDGYRILTAFPQP